MSVKKPRRLCVLLLIVAAGCLNRPLSGVGVKDLASQLVFGIPPLPEAVTPPDAGPAGNLNVRELEEDPSLTGGRRTSARPGARGQVCPEAPLGSSADPVPDRVPNTVKDGIYRYKYAGSQGSGESAVSLSGFSNRRVFGFQPTNANPPQLTYQFTVRQKDLRSGKTKVLTFMVDQTSPSRAISEQQHPVDPAEQVFVSSPDSASSGIFLERIAELDSDGKESAVFQPRPHIKYLDIPVLLGEAFTTEGVDQSTFQQMRLAGRVANRRLVDACGVLTDSWLVEATQTITDPTGQVYQTKLIYGIANHMGGLIVFDHVEDPATNPNFTLESTIGQLVPDEPPQ